VQLVVVVVVEAISDDGKVVAVCGLTV